MKKIKGIITNKLLGDTMAGTSFYYFSLLLFALLIFLITYQLWQYKKKQNMKHIQLTMVFSVIGQAIVFMVILFQFIHFLEYLYEIFPIYSEKQLLTDINSLNKHFIIIGLLYFIFFSVTIFGVVMIKSISNSVRNNKFSK